MQLTALQTSFRIPLVAHTLLIAEDDPASLQMLREELQARGYLVLSADNGLSALNLANKHHPDLIILDVAMPMTSGLRAFKQLRSASATQTTPVIFLTGLPSKDVYPTVAEGHRVAHLKKPIDIEDLVSLIQQFLQPKQGR